MGFMAGSAFWENALLCRTVCRRYLLWLLCHLFFSLQYQREARARSWTPQCLRGGLSQHCWANVPANTFSDFFLFLLANHPPTDWDFPQTYSEALNYSLNYPLASTSFYLSNIPISFLWSLKFSIFWLGIKLSKKSYHGFLSYWERISSGVLQGSALDLLLFNTFINNLSSGMLIKFAGDTELGGFGCPLEGITRIQNDLEKLNSEPEGNSVKTMRRAALEREIKCTNTEWGVSVWAAVWQKRSWIIMDHKLWISEVLS